MRMIKQTVLIIVRRAIALLVLIAMVGLVRFVITLV
jgi:hypothetical protein